MIKEKKGSAVTTRDRMEIFILTLVVGLIIVLINGGAEASFPKILKQNMVLRRIRTVSADGYVTVKVDGGFLKGRISKSATGELITSFQGIPYAKPPIGHLRFMNPQSFEAWNGTRDALKESNICPQFENKTLVGDEDCLYLNIYTRSLPFDKDCCSLPVMVWIHGGYFVQGSGNINNYGPDYLLKEDVIVVTLNYRLGPLGFLFLPDKVPGNAGLKDQVFALRWIQNNIRVFGGDPNLVTIFGQSAGAASVHLHMLSPLSKGLFHRAIAQSGSAIQKVFVQPSPIETSQRLAKAVNCTEFNTTATVECMQNVDVLSLLFAGQMRDPSEQKQEIFPSFNFVPTSENNTGPNHFLPEPAIKLVQEGKHHDIPYLTGYTDAESLLMFAFVNLFSGEAQLYLDNSWADKIFDDMITVEKRKQDEAEKTLRRFYLHGHPLSNSTLKGYLNMLTDIYGESIVHTLKYMDGPSKTPLYLYYFTVDDDLNENKRALGIKLPGACHGDDLGYLFHMDHLPLVLENSAAEITRRSMVRLWANFAKYGEPGYIDEFTKWLPYNTKTEFYLELSNPPLRLKNDINPERTKFWEEFHKEYGLFHTKK